MKYLSKFDLFQEARGVADATLYLVEPICDYILDETTNFKNETIDEDSSETTLDVTWTYDDLKPYLPKKADFAWFPVSKIVLELKLFKEKDKWEKYPFMVGGWASHFGKKKEESVSKFRKGVKRNPDHSISLNMGIEVYVGTFDPDNEKVLNDFKIKLESVVLHELNHLYEYYRRTWDPYGRNIQTSITWASIGEAPEDISKKIFSHWQDNFTTYIYQSEPHEVRAQIQELKAYVDRLDVEGLKKANPWKNIKRMQNFDENKFMEGLHEKALEVDPNLIESEVLHKLIKAWKKEYKTLYKQQTEKNNPTPDFFKKMSDAQFMTYWGKKIRQAGSDILRGVLRQYANKKED